MADRLEDVLDQCVEEIRAGRSTVEEALARHPSLQEDLDPLLRLALRLVPPTLTIDPTRKRAARVRFLEALAQEQEPRRAWSLGEALARLRAGLFPSPLPVRAGLPGTIAAVLALALATGSAAVYAAEQAQPEDGLYGLKIALDEVRVAAARDEEERAAAQVEIASSRLAEIERALETKNERAVQIAADHYARALEKAQGQLAPSPSRDRRSDVLEKLEQKVEQQQRSLERATERASGPARPSLERARERARTGRAAVTAAGLGPEVAPVRVPPTATRAVATEQSSAATSTPRPKLTAEAGQLEALADQTRRLEGAASAQGSVEQGLLAKLNAARAALARGQPETAANQLRAFENHLEAEHRSDRIDDDTYVRLLRAAQAIILALDEDDRPGRGRGRDQSPAGRDRGPNTGPAPPPGTALTTIPTGPRDRGQGRVQGAERTARPGGAATSTATPRSTVGTQVAPAATATPETDRRGGGRGRSDDAPGRGLSEEGRSGEQGRLRS